MTPGDLRVEIRRGSPTIHWERDYTHVYLKKRQNTVIAPEKVRFRFRVSLTDVMQT